MNFSLSLLGTLRVTFEGEAVSGFRTKKERVLLAYLATEANHWQRRGMLAELLWPNRPEGVARNNLRQVLFRIRQSRWGKQLHESGIFQVSRNAIRLNTTEEVWLDVVKFDDGLKAVQKHAHENLAHCTTCMSHLQDAVELYRDEFLAGIELKDSSEFQMWLMVNREKFFRQQLNALNGLTNACHKSGDLTSALHYARKQVVLAPLEETAHRQLMALLGASGQRSAALKQYQTCRRMLADELGVEVEPETRILYKKLRAECRRSPKADISSTILPPSSLPIQLTAFIGRKPELVHITRHLANPDCRLLTIVGPGGVGKTRLALKAAAEQRGTFPDGVWFIPMEAVEPQVHVDFLAGHIGQAMKLSYTDQEDIKSQLFTHLQSLHALLVMDNFEHLLHRAPLVIDILSHAPHVKVLVTSRERLDYKVEYLLDLEGLPYPDFRLLAADAGFDKLSSQITNLQFYGAVQLFIERVGRVRADFCVSEENISHINSICQLVEGSPLAIELAATWMRECSCVQIENKIENNLDSLTVSLLDLPERHRSLRAVFEGSWNLLSKPERRVYRKLSVFRGGFTYDAAQIVTDVTRAQLSALVAKSLLRRSAPARYNQHPLLRQYAREKLRQTPMEDRETCALHNDYYLNFVQEREEELMGEHAREALAEINTEIANVRAAWEWAVDQGCIETLEGSIRVLSCFYDLSGLFQEGEMVFGRAAERLLNMGAGEDILCRLLVEQASFLFERGMYERTIECSRTAIRQAHTAQDPIREARGYRYWGEALRNLGELKLARTKLEQGLFLVRGEESGTHPEGRAEIDVQQVELKTLNTLACVCWMQSDYDGAEAFLQHSLRVAVEAGVQRGQATVLGNLGILAVEQGNYTGALGSYRQSLRIRQTMGDRHGSAVALGNIGNVYLYLGAYDESKKYIKQALQILQEIDSRQGEALVMGNLGLIYYYQGNHASAKEYCQQALKIARELGDPGSQGAIWMKLGHALAGLGQLDRAAKAYRESITLQRELGQTILATETLAGLAGVVQELGQNNEALLHVEEILGVVGDCKNLNGVIDPFQVCLTCYQVLQASDDPRSSEILRHAYQRLQERVTKIDDGELRRSYLENVQSQRALVSLYQDVVVFDGIKVKEFSFGD